MAGAPLLTMLPLFVTDPFCTSSIAAWLSPSITPVGILTMLTAFDVVLWIPPW